jgi:hypothetical protein
MTFGNQGSFPDVKVRCAYTKSQVVITRYSLLATQPGLKTQGPFLFRLLGRPFFIRKM